VVQALAALSEHHWKAEPIVEALKALAEAEGLKLGDVMQPVRVALTGSTVSEPVNELLAVVGRERSLARLQEMASPRSEPGAA
jgi:glutamyl-tRNA synthetase